MGEKTNAKLSDTSMGSEEVAAERHRETKALEGGFCLRLPLKDATFVVGIRLEGIALREALEDPRLFRKREGRR